MFYVRLNWVACPAVPINAMMVRLRRRHTSDHMLEMVLVSFHMRVQVPEHGLVFINVASSLTCRSGKKPS